MIDDTDLKRWNRAGLRRFRYIDGNAVNFLEFLREAFAQHLGHWEDVKPDPTDLPVSENEYTSTCTCASMCTRLLNTS